MRIYQSFEEITENVIQNTPEIIYKYRTWGIKTNEQTIKDLTLWFAHPHSLNDPYDVRPPYNFIAEGIDMEQAKNKMREAGRSIDPHLTLEELEVEVENRFEAFSNNPIEYFKKTRGHEVLEASNYDRIGILSCCLSDNNEAMWAYYGNNQTGFAIGFKTVGLAEVINASFGYVDYSDEPINYHIMGDNEGIIEAEIFRKSAKWSVEQELRFATCGIDVIRNRVIKFPVDVVAEIVLGVYTTKETEQAIINEASKSMPNIPIYKLQTKVDSFGFDKIRIV